MERLWVGPLPWMHRVEGASVSAGDEHGTWRPLARIFRRSCVAAQCAATMNPNSAAQRAFERVGMALVWCSCVCRFQGAMRVCPNWDRRSPCSGCIHSKYGVREQAWSHGRLLELQTCHAGRALLLVRASGARRVADYKAVPAPSSGASARPPAQPQVCRYQLIGSCRRWCRMRRQRAQCPRRTRSRR